MRDLREDYHSRDEEITISPKVILVWASCVAVSLVILLGTVMGSIWGFKAFNRTQRVAEAENQVTTSRIKANNKVKLNEIRIGQQAQKVKIAEQDAEIRFRESQGIRKSQDEIAKTLTPQYLQHEMIQQISKVSKSGKNSSVIYIPVGPDGLPVTAVENPENK